MLRTPPGQVLVRAGFNICDVVRLRHVALFLLLAAGAAAAAPTRSVEMEFVVWPPASTFTSGEDGLYEQYPDLHYVAPLNAPVSLQLPADGSLRVFVVRHRHFHDAAVPLGVHSETRQFVRLQANSPLWDVWFGYVLPHPIPCSLAVVALAAATLAGARHWKRHSALSQMASPLDSYIGRIVDGYRIVEPIGEGGMGIVYRADGPSGPAAVKLIRRVTGPNEEEQRRFRREIQICAGLRHPNIVLLYSYGELEGSSYLAMELLTGETLARRMRRGPLAVLEFLDVMRQLLDALIYLHEHLIVHRDLKPANVMLCEGGRVKVMDFGIARTQLASTITNTGEVLGTLAYVAPEQLEGDPVTPAVDQYSLGVMALEMLSGRRAFEAQTVENMLFVRIARPRLPSLAELTPDLPPALAALVDRMVSHDAGARYPDLHAVQAALEAL